MRNCRTTFIKIWYLSRQNPFGSPKELDGLSNTLVDLPKAALYVGALVFVAAAGTIGSVIGTKAPGMCYSPAHASFEMVRALLSLAFGQN